MASLNNKVVLVTDADSPVGKETALHFAEEKSRLSLCGTDAKKLEEAVKACTVKGADVFQVHASLDNDSDLMKIITETVTHFGQLDVLVAFTGPVYHGTVETVDTNKLNSVLQRNVTNIVQLCQHAVPHLAKTTGNIVVISSLGGIKSFPRLMPHCVAATALDMFIRCTAVDLGPKGIRVNSVCSGLIEDGSDSCKDPEFSKFIELRPNRPDHMQIPLGSKGSVEHVANMAVFLASSDASFMTGTSVPVDGGVINVYPR